MADRVLLVDDDDELREALADVLQAAGYLVDVTANGREAMVQMRACSPGLVLLDLMMPVMDGWEVVAEMQRDPTLASIPVCVLSAMSNTAPVSQCVLAKPISGAALRAAVKQHCLPG
jgi:CheY-like chemotaxis protein